MKLTCLCIFIAVVFCSCNNSSSISENKKSDTLSDALKKWTLTINDTTYKEVNSLNADFILQNYSPGDKEANWEVVEYLKIDSLKKSNRYTDYMDKLDIGMMKDANAWVYDTLEFENAKAILWGVTYSSYDACPFFSGKSIYLTSFSNEGKAISTLKVLKNSNSADAPVFLYTVGECKLESTGFITCLDTIVNGDQAMDESTGKEYEDITRETELRKYQLTKEGNFKELERKKSQPAKEKKYLDFEAN